MRIDKAVAVIMALVGTALLNGCSDGAAPGGPGTMPARTWRMGFSGIPPRADVAQAIRAIDLWSRRADAAIISTELPWGPLLDGIPADSLVRVLTIPLANYYRSKGHELWVYLDPANGLNRAGESDTLVARGRSIRDSSVQRLFRLYAVAMDTIVRPRHLGLALETNLIRGVSPPALYDAIRRVVNDAAADVRAHDSTVLLSVSVQVDYAWGALAGGAYLGVDTDYIQFPFIQELGLSSYPYLAGYSNPDSLPTDYYARLGAGHALPLMVTEGGWTSASLGAVVSSPEIQRRYIVRQQTLLDSAKAIAVFQLTFTDLDLAGVALPPGSILPLFAHLGLVDADLNPKAALSAWDAGFARPRK